MECGIVCVGRDLGLNQRNFRGQLQVNQEAQAAVDLQEHGGLFLRDDFVEFRDPLQAQAVHRIVGGDRTLQKTGGLGVGEGR